MLERFICKTIARQVENIVHENYGITCLHDVCEDMAKVFLYLYVGTIDCETVVCTRPTLTFTPTDVEEFACTTTTISETGDEDPPQCFPVTITSF